MKKRMLRILAVILALTLTVGMAFAVGGEDSLISLSYLTGIFQPKAVSSGSQVVGEELQESLDDGLTALKKAQEELRKNASGDDVLYSANLALKEWSDGDMVRLPTGSGFFMGEGTAVLSHAGAVVDVTAGTEVASGTALIADHRYLVGEDTLAEITVLSGAARLGVQGDYSWQPGKTDHTPFYDVCRLDWYYSAVEYVYQNGLFAGMSEHEFGPDTVMSRAMVMTVFYNLAGRPAEEMAAAHVSFEDVPDEAWFAPFVRWAASQQITAGTSPTTFTPDQLINREQMITLLYSFATRYLGLELTARADLTGFADYEKINVWAREPLSWAVAEGVIGSVSADTALMDPSGHANRASVAAMLQVFAQATD